ncbi:MAG: hypothetical protein A4E19_06665 [Nitrospira sp. SG-bin1]|nr:MAG: hypothetical protein A4E19_06665 [Nitrospira sp. SG-bin1]
MTSVNHASSTSPQVAVLLYGMLRTFRVTAPSFLRHVVLPNNADVFYFGPAQSDAPSLVHKGRLDLFGNVKANPKGQMGSTGAVSEDDLAEAYGPALRQYRFHDVAQEEFVRQAAIVPREEWIFGLNPARMFSMVFNMEGAINLLLQHEKTQRVRYHFVILTRPDLAFFSPIKAEVKFGHLHIPSGEGFDEWGRKHLRNASVLYYKNVMTGDVLEGADRHHFNDQLFLFRREDLPCFTHLGKCVIEYLARKVPASPETILFLHLCQRNGLVPIYHPEWCYEIYREGMPLVVNVADTSMIQRIDRYHPKARERFRKHPIGTLMRDGKILVKRAFHRLTR